MERRDCDRELDALIRASMKIEDRPSEELNNRLKASLYEREATMQREEKTRKISLWYLPMVCNFLTFTLLAVLALMMIPNPYIARFVAGVCGYISILGIVITVIGVSRTNMKESIVIFVKKRGLKYEI